MLAHVCYDYCGMWIAFSEFNIAV